MPRHSELAKIERTGLKVTKLSLGTAPLGGLFTSVPEADSDGVIAAAFAADINFYDTAPLYGFGRAEVDLVMIDLAKSICQQLIRYRYLSPLPL